jgi:hypothetical protein
MLMSTVVAVALGMAPIKQDGTVTGDYSKIVGSYSQTVDKRGTTHLSGFHRITGAPFDLTIDKDGNVEGNVGEMMITFQAREAA